MGPNALRGPMGETETAEDAKTGPLTAGEAEDAIARLEGFSEPLQTRTGGITWMIWAVVTAGIFATYWAAPASVGNRAVLWFLWLPWVAAGHLLTGALWRSVALTLDLPEDPSERTWWAVYVFGITALFFVVLGAYHLVLGEVVSQDVFWLGFFGAFTFLMIYLTGHEPRSARVMAVAGAVLLALAAVAATAGLPAWVAASAAPVAWFVGGGTLAFHG